VTGKGAFNMNSYEAERVTSVVWSARFYACNLYVPHKFLFVTDMCIMLSNAVMQTCYDSFSRSQAQQFMLLICDCDISLLIGGCNVEAIRRKIFASFFHKYRFCQKVYAYVGSINKVYFRTCFIN